MGRGRGSLGAVLLLLLTAFAAPARGADEESPELRARTYFAAARYKEALEIYARLYAETLHPTYLRNIARCYQGLKDPDKAISSFQEYLRKARDLSPQQQAEIEKFIAEMEQLKKSQATATTPPAPAPAPTAPAPPPPAAPPPAAPLPAAPEPATAATSPALLDSSAVVTKRADDTESAPVYTRWWFWATVAVVAAAGVTGAVLLSSGGDPSHGSVGALDLTDKNP